MKKNNSLILGFIICIAFITTSCKDEIQTQTTPKSSERLSIEKDKISEEVEIPNLKGLKYKLPDNISEEILTFDTKSFKGKFHKLLLSKNKDAKTRFSDYHFDLKTLEVIIKETVDNYPNKKSTPEKRRELINKYFPNITEDQYVKRKVDIDAFYNQLIINESIEKTIEIMSEDKNKKGGRISSDYYTVTFDEWWFYVTHSDYGSCAEEVRQKAAGYAFRIFPGDPQDTKSDAFRHSLWMNLLAKYGGSGESDVATAAMKASVAGYYHEYGVACWIGCDAPPLAPDKEMDLHNNRVGTDYFKTIAWTYVVWGGLWGLFSDIDVAAPSDDWIASGLANKANWGSVLVPRDLNSVWSVPVGILVYFE